MSKTYPQPTAVRLIERFSRAAAITLPTDLPISSESFVAAFVTADIGNSLIDARAAIRLIQRWFGSDAELARGRLDDLAHFWAGQARSGETPPVRLNYRWTVVRTAARLLLYLQSCGIGATQSWESDAALVNAYADVLADEDYGPWSTVQKMAAFAHFAIWCRLNRFGRDELDLSLASRFAQHSCLCSVGARLRGPCPKYSEGYHTAAIRYIRMVRGEHPLLTNGLLANRQRVFHDPPAPSVAAFLEELHTVRGLHPATLGTYRREVLRWHGELGEDASRYTAQLVRSVYLRQLETRRPRSPGLILGSMRAYLAFRGRRGECPIELPNVLLPRRHYQQARIPRVVDYGHLRDLVARDHPSTDAEIRDHAIMRLLLETGLRGGEVRHLQLTDLDFKNARLKIHGKGGRHAVVPLTQKAGEALLRYVEQVRPPATDLSVFLRLRAPFVVVDLKGISYIAAKWLRRHGLAGGSHLFRHSLATAILDQGGSLQNVATILRHQNVDTSRIYAKVSVRMLMAVAQPYPGARP